LLWAIGLSPLNDSRRTEIMLIEMPPILLLIGFLLATWSLASAQEKGFSHPRMRPAPTRSTRAPAIGPVFHVDANQGSDSAAGSQDAPWKTFQHSLGQLSPGDTLYLHNGTYYETVACAVAGTKDKPITIRSAPGELAFIDGGLREFLETPETCWVPSDASPGEYRSSKPYKNLREIHGCFADSMIGLQTYYYAPDLRGERYVGPGVWYDRVTGYIHARLVHHKQFKGETDPRKLPLVLAASRSVPLTIDRAYHVKLQDLVIRGGGYDTALIRYGVDVEFDGVVIYAGTYGLKARNTGPFRFLHSAVYGNIPPWSVRGEAGLEEVPWTKSTKKDLTRLNTHAVLVAEPGFEEWDVNYYPYNSDWEIAYSDFTEGADGLYLGNVDGLKFHHNYVDGFLDDIAYLSHFRPIRKSHGPTHIYQNYFGSAMISFAFGGPGVKGGEIYFYRNIVNGQVFLGDHGGPPWDGMYIYHNTVLSKSAGAVYGARGEPWYVLNNIIRAGQRPQKEAPAKAVITGNLGGDISLNDRFQPEAGSKAIDAGEPVPVEWPDPVRDQDKGRPDIGAVPAGAKAWQMGRTGVN
jgi:hypothetical protein